MLNIVIWVFSWDLGLEIESKIWDTVPEGLWSGMWELIWDLPITECLFVSADETE